MASANLRHQRMFPPWLKPFTVTPKRFDADVACFQTHCTENLQKKPKNLIIFGFFLLTYAQKFFS
jgi:hypothetical protein